MNKYSSYLVCGGYINEVKDFLMDFFREEKNDYSFENWVMFEIPNTNFTISLMGADSELPLTQNMTFEITCGSMQELEGYSNKFNKKVQSFVAKNAPQKYTYYYIEIPGPKNICKMEINYIEDLD